MDDPSVFAVITAFDKQNLAASALRLEHNSKWFHGATGGVPTKPTIASREPTPGPDDPGSRNEGKANVIHGFDRLVLTLDQLCSLDNLENGLQLGTHQTHSHVLLGHRGMRGSSSKQCNITVDESLRIWLHDYHSTHGTAVGLNGQHETAVRKGETWILALEPGRRDDIETRTIHCGALGVSVEFPNHVAAPPSYIEKLRVFVKKCRGAAEDLHSVRALSLGTGPLTLAPSNVPTSRQAPIYVRVGMLGKGTYGKVHKVIRARDASVFAAKFFQPPPNKRALDAGDPKWLIDMRREFTIARNNPHPNVIEVFELRETPEPSIIMAYYPDGSMAGKRLSDPDQYITALGQVLDGLCHLHKNNLAHRDLKPGNLLVQLAPPFKVVIADFGLTKVADEAAPLHTFCGTDKYMAPEVFPLVGRFGHGQLVDIWSLGVMAWEWLYGVPPTPPRPKPAGPGQEITPEQWRQWMRTWLKRFVEHRKHQQPPGNIAVFLSHMLRLKPDVRWTASQCLEKGLAHGLFRRRKVDDLVESARYPEVLPPEPKDDGAKIPTAPPPSLVTAEATAILQNMRNGSAGDQTIVPSGP